MSLVFAGLLTGLGGALSLASLASPLIPSWRDFLNRTASNDVNNASSELAMLARDLAAVTIKRYVVELQSIEADVQRNYDMFKTRRDAGAPLAAGDAKEVDYVTSLKLLKNTIQSAKEAQKYAEDMYRSRTARLKTLLTAETDPWQRNQLDYQENSLLYQDLRNIQVGQEKLLKRVMDVLKADNVPFTERPDGVFSTIATMGLSEGDKTVDARKIQPPATFEDAIANIQEFRASLTNRLREVNADYIKFNEVYTYMTQPRGAGGDGNKGGKNPNPNPGSGASGGPTKGGAMFGGNNDGDPLKKGAVDKAMAEKVREEFGQSMTLLKNNRDEVNKTIKELIGAEGEIRLAKIQGNSFDSILEKWTSSKNSYMIASNRLTTMQNLLKDMLERKDVLETSREIAPVDITRRIDELLDELKTLS